MIPQVSSPLPAPVDLLAPPTQCHLRGEVRAAFAGNGAKLDAAFPGVERSGAAHAPASAVTTAAGTGTRVDEREITNRFNPPFAS